MKKSFILLLVLALSGCANLAKGQLYQDKPIPQGLAQIVFYLPEKTVSPLSFDGAKVRCFLLANGYYVGNSRPTTMLLDSGKYGSFNMEKQHRYFVRVSLNPDANVIGDEWKYERVSEETARQELVGLRESCPT